MNDKAPMDVRTVIIIILLVIVALFVFESPTALPENCSIVEYDEVIGVDVECY